MELWTSVCHHRLLLYHNIRKEENLCSIFFYVHPAMEYNSFKTMVTLQDFSPPETARLLMYVIATAMIKPGLFTLAAVGGSPLDG